MSRLAAMVVLLAGLSQLAPSSTTLLVTVALVAFAVALVRRGATVSWLRVPVWASAPARRSRLVTRQYEPATAGRPQPRAPGCGR